jgi:hypothetical protein
VIRLSWLQFRAQAVVAAAGLAIIAVVLALTGPHLVDIYRASVATCKNPPPPPVARAMAGPVLPSVPQPSYCLTVVDAFRGHEHILQESLTDIVLVIPAVIGLFWGAPLAARELETGAFRLAWTQSVTRGRWLAVKLAAVGLGSIAVAGLLSLMVTWWSSPLDRTYASQFIAFSERGIAPIGYAAFGFVLGVTAGLLIRRTVPAMAATVIPYIGARVAVTVLRPHFMTPVTAAQRLPDDVNPNTLGLDAWPTYQSGNWVLASNTLTTTGRPVDPARLSCNQSVRYHPGQHITPPSPGAMQKQLQACAPHVYAYVAKLREILTYQPASRYWTFQAIETGIFLALAAALAVTCFWWIRRRIC